MSKTICIVDGYSTGAELAPLFRKEGWRCVHIQSNPVIPGDYLLSYRPETFDKHLVLRDHSVAAMRELAVSLAFYGPTVIIPGTETGVELADFLATELGTAGNDYATSALRRNKFKMQEALRQGGLRSIPQMVTDSLADAWIWVKTSACWPVVVKPVDSAGADGVRFCHNFEELNEAFNDIHGKTNRLGLHNSEVLLQERLIGRQFIVNAVSINGEHLISEIWSDDKKQVRNASLICEKEVLLPYQGKEQEALIAYMQKALTLLGIKNGPSHSELMMTAKGPVLIETAARMQGTIMHSAVVAALGYSHVTLTAERYLHPQRFAARLQQHYQVMKTLYCVTLASDVEGVVRQNRCQELLAQLPSFYGVMHTPDAGEKIYRTTDLFTNPGIIYLCHESQQQIEEDYAQIRAFEKNGALFELA
jgi:biotin carboxylase